MSPDPGLSESSREVLEQFAAAAGQEVAPGSVRLLAGEIRISWPTSTGPPGRSRRGHVDDVRGFMIEMAPRRPAGIGNVCGRSRGSSLPQRRRLSDVRVDGLLAHAAPRRVRALPCFTREETGRLLEGIETGTPCGKRDYAMVVLAVSTGLRCCDIVALRWRRSTGAAMRSGWSRPRHPTRWLLPLPRLAGNAVAEWICTDGPGVTPRSVRPLKAPLVKLGNSTGSTLMRPAWTGPESITRPVTASRSMPCGARRGHAHRVGGRAAAGRAGPGPCRIDSSRRYFALASEQIRSAACRWMSSPAPGRAAMNTFTSNFAPHIEGDARMRTSLGHSPRDMSNAWRVSTGSAHRITPARRC